MKVAKWGNSLAIRIPRDVVDALGLGEGDEVALQRSDDRTLVISRVMSRAEAIEGLRAYRGRLPADFKFDRDEANGG